MFFSQFKIPETQVIILHFTFIQISLFAKIVKEPIFKIVIGQVLLLLN